MSLVEVSSTLEEGLSVQMDFSQSSEFCCCCSRVPGETWSMVRNVNYIRGAWSKITDENSRFAAISIAYLGKNLD